MNRVSEQLVIPLPVQDESSTEPSLMADVVALTKARLTLLVIVTTFVGFCLAPGGTLDWLQLVQVLVGTALVAACAQVLNQVIEQDVDRLMERTRNRPLPAGRMRRHHAAYIGVGMGAAGLLILAGTVNLLAAALAALTLFVYLGAYTPLKRKTPLCIPVGAVAGAIPPVIGWVAATPTIGWGAWVLFAVLFAWQMPHFLAIAWMYRDEYAGAGFVMLRQRDLGGFWTAVESLVYALLLAGAAVSPVILGTVHPLYLIGATVLNVGMVYYALQFLFARNRPSARRLFFASIIYLPVVLSLLVFAKA